MKSKRKTDKPDQFQVSYKPNRNQVKLEAAIAGGAKVILMVGGIRSGKSVGGIMSAIQQHYVYRKKPKLGWIVSPYYKMSQAAEGIFRKYVYSPHGSLVIHHSASKNQYFLRPTPDDPTPFCVEFKSASDPDKLRGWSIAFAVMDEAAMMKPAAFDILRGRTMDCGGILILTTTPRGKNWLYTDVYQRSLSDPRYVTIHAPTLENEYLDAERIEQLRSEYASKSSIQAKQEIDGEFVDFRGRVFTEFASHSHVFDEEELPANAEVICGIDWGFNDPFVCVWLAKWDNCWIVLDEYYKTQGLLKDHAAHILNHKYAHRVKRYWCDPSGLQQRKEFVEMGVRPMLPARKKRVKRPTDWPTDRARTMNLLFSRRVSCPWKEGDMVPGLIFWDSIQHGRREVEHLAYRRFVEETDQGVVVTNPDGKEFSGNATEQLEDKDNHFVDALGYAIFSEIQSSSQEPFCPDVTKPKLTPAEEARAALKWWMDQKNPLLNPPKPSSIEPFDTLGL